MGEVTEQGANALSPNIAIKYFYTSISNIHHNSLCISLFHYWLKHHLSGVTWPFNYMFIFNVSFPLWNCLPYSNIRLPVTVIRPDSNSKGPDLRIISCITIPAAYISPDLVGDDTSPLRYSGGRQRSSKDENKSKQEDNNEYETYFWFTPLNFDWITGVPMGEMITGIRNSVIFINGSIHEASWYN